MLLIDQLKLMYPEAKTTTLRRMVEGGRVRVNGKVAGRVKQELAEKDQVEVNAEGAAKTPAGDVKRRGAFGGRTGEAFGGELHPLKKVYEDEHVLVVVKPAGLLSSTVPGEKRPTAVALVRGYLAQTDPKARVGTIHRLDRDAQGLLVFSKNNAAYEALKRQFYVHSVKRVYLAIVAGKLVPKEGKIQSKLVERADGTVHSVRPGVKKGEVALTHFKSVRELGDGRWLVRVTLHTGRKHQIRVHLSERKCPIVGDTVYGGPEARVLMLAAVELAFDHPATGERLELEIPMPEVMKEEARE